MWKASYSLFALAILFVLGTEVRANKGLVRGASRMDAEQKVGQVSSSSFFALSYTTTTSDKQQLRHLKKDEDVDEGVNIPFDYSGRTEDAENNNNEGGGEQQSQQQQQQQATENTLYDDSTLEQICSSANGSFTSMTTENNLSVKYEYRMFTDQVGDRNTVLQLGNKVNLQIAQYLKQIYIVNFCNDYQSGSSRGLSPGDVRTVVPGNTELLGANDCDSQGVSVPCVRMQSSATVHFAPEYAFASRQDEVGDTILSDVSAAFKSGVGLEADPDVSGAIYTTGSLGTVGYEPPQTTPPSEGGEDNNTQGDNDNNSGENSENDGDTTDRGNIEASEQGSTNNAPIVVKDKMSRVGKFFLSIFILGLVGGLIYALVKLRRVEKTHSFDDDENSAARGDGTDSKFGATVDWFKRRLHISRGEDNDRGDEKIGRAETDEDDEETMEVELSRKDRSQVSLIQLLRFVP